jgi:hypothetical protein
MKRTISLTFSTTRLPESFVCDLCKRPFEDARKPENVIRGRYDNWVTHTCPEPKEES